MVHDATEAGADAAQLAAERPTLTAAAFRMLGTYADAEDAVQEAYARWFRLDDAARRAIVVPGAWLMRVTARICLDVLGSARVRRESYAGEWLPEPVPAFSDAATVDPLDAVVRGDSVSTALLLVLETLTPAERVVFVLREVFGLSFTEIADAIGRTPAACRQLATSARRHVGERRGAVVPRGRHDELVAAFAQAASTGELARLVAVLDPAVVLRSDGGGVVSAARRPVRGADDVGRFLLGLARKNPSARYEPVVTGDGAGILLRLGEGSGAEVAGVISFATDGDRVTDVWIMRNPAKLRLWS